MMLLARAEGVCQYAPCIIAIYTVWETTVRETLSYGRELTVGKESYLEQTLPDSNPSDLLRHLVIKSECILRDNNTRELTVGKNNHLCIIIRHVGDHATVAIFRVESSFNSQVFSRF